MRAAAVVRFAGFQRLHFYTLPLHLPVDTPLHSVTASQAARAVTAAVFGSTPARWKLERGQRGALHVHVISPLPPVAVSEFSDARPVWDLRGLLGYFAKPAEAALCRPVFAPDAPDAYTRARVYRAALAEQCRARAERQAQGFSRLPPVAGWTGRRPGAPSPLFRVRASLALALLALARLQALHGALRHSPALGPAPQSAGPFLTRTAARSPYRARPRAPDRTARGLAR